MSKSNISIFTRKNQSLISLYEEAGDSKKVACVALDYAKKTHTALICDGAGRRLKGSFSVANNPEGVAFLFDQVQKITRKHHLHSSHIFFGGEDCGSYSLNFIHAIRQKGFLVVGVDPKQAKNQRQNFQASTDKLDLLGIAKLLTDQVGSSKTASESKERTLRCVVRHRANMVVTTTALSNRIHSLVDQLFPGFLDETKSGIPPFSDTSLWLMEERFSPNQIQSRNHADLLKQAKLKGLPSPEQRIAQLKAYAGMVLHPAPSLVGILQSSLRHDVHLYRALQRCIQQADKESAVLLAQTPGAMLTTIRGTGITLAAGVASEIGDPFTQPSLRRLTSSAGIIPRVKQTGGPTGRTFYGSVSKRSNHILKNFIVQCGSHQGLHGADDLKEDHQRRKANSQHADYGVARRYLRIAMRLMKSHQAYLPTRLLSQPESGALATYYLESWPRLRDIWKKADALKMAFAPENPLGQWRQCIQELYQIQLPLL